jgi:HD-GYP domain-containing protein (c-di-GMP phosphodiesterase class II)
LKYVPIPIALLAVGKPLPVNVVSDTGQLLLRKGQPIVSEQHRDKLHAFNASTTPADALAWQRAYERMVHMALREGMELKDIAGLPMPSEIRESDYVVGQQLQGGWLDLQEVLRGILYQGGLAINPLARLAGIEKKAQELLKADADDSLFSLFQALADDSLGYCATHALLCTVVCALTADKLGIEGLHKASLLHAALTMNIGMAREQDSMARQSSALSDWQRGLIAEHPLKSVGMLQSFGVDDPDQLDIVRWHHAPKSPEAESRNLAARRILSFADGFIARMAARKTRSPLSAVKAVKSMVLGAEGPEVGVGSAMAQAVGFYPPGSYVQLVNGDTAVSVQRGARANTPWVVSILDKDGLPITMFIPRDTSEAAWTIESPVSFEKVRIAVSIDKVRRVRDRIPR